MACTPARKAIIIGGGPAGVALALRLHQKSNISCTIYELRPEPTTLGGAIGIMANGLRLYDRLGVYEDMLNLGYETSTAVIHTMGGHTLGQQEMLDPAVKKVDGYGYLRIKRTDILAVLLRAAEKASIPVHYGKEVTGIQETEQNVTAIFSDGTTGTADLLFGCDGIHSAVRKLYVDPGKMPEYFGFASLSALIPTAGLPGPPFTGISMTFTTEGTFMAVPCTPDASEIAWGFQRELPVPSSADARDGWEIKRTEEVAGFKDHLLALLKDAKGEWGDRLRQVVSKTETVKFYPIYRLAVGGTWSKGRCLLVGDAAHAMPPQAGQGLSMAMEDVFLLGRLLEKQELTVTDVFAKYDEIRRPRLEKIGTQAVKNARLTKKTSPTGLAIKESMVWTFFQAKAAFRLPSWGFDRQVLAYDIDQVPLEA